MQGVVPRVLMGAVCAAAAAYCASQLWRGLSIVPLVASLVVLYLVLRMLLASVVVTDEQLVTKVGLVRTRTVPLRDVDRAVVVTPGRMSPRAMLRLRNGSRFRLTATIAGRQQQLVDDLNAHLDTRAQPKG